MSVFIADSLTKRDALRRLGEDRCLALDKALRAALRAAVLRSVCMGVASSINNESAINGMAGAWGCSLTVAEDEVIRALASVGATDKSKARAPWCLVNGRIADRLVRRGILGAGRDVANGATYFIAEAPACT